MHSCHNGNVNTGSAFDWARRHVDAGLAWAFLTNRADRTSVDIDELDEDAEDDENADEDDEADAGDAAAEEDDDEIDDADESDPTER